MCLLHLYPGNTLTEITGEQVLLVEIKLDGKKYHADKHPATVTGMVAGSSKRGKGPGQIALSMADVMELLNANDTARMVVVLTTHCIAENGMLVWGGTRTESMTCHLHSVCIARYPPVFT